MKIKKKSQAGTMQSSDLMVFVEPASPVETLTTGYAATAGLSFRLSDRFGLWLGFHACDQQTYLAMIRGYVEHYEIELDEAELTRQANEWAVTRGGRSGRVAWQFVQDLAGRLQHRLE